jgi:hypothetical protein
MLDGDWSSDVFSSDLITGSKKSTQTITGSSATTWKLDAGSSITTDSGDFYALTDYNMGKDEIATGQPIVIAGSISSATDGIGLYGVHTVTIAKTAEVSSTNGAVLFFGTKAGYELVNNGDIISSSGVGVEANSTMSILNTGTISGTDVIRFLPSGNKAALDVTNSEGATMTGSTNGLILDGSAKVTNGGTISSIIGVYSTDGIFKLSNSGTIDATDSAVRADSDNFSVVNQKSGTFDGSVAFLTSADDGVLKNYGTITSDNEAVYLNGASDLINYKGGGIEGVGYGVHVAASGASVTNAGKISAESYGVYLGGAKAELTNSGRIEGTIFGVDMVGAGTSFVNEAGGVVTGGTYSVWLANSGGKTSFVNEGKVVGSSSYTIYGNEGASVVTNRGSIGGAISLGGGADTFRNDGGTVSGTIDGGAGNDTYVVDSKSLSLSEASGSGKDTVRSSVTWTLGADFETLVLTGSKAIGGTGNAAANTITGNDKANEINGLGGADVLVGGKGADTFVFSDGSGANKVKDFVDGTDLIDVSGHAITTFGELGISYDATGATIDLGSGDTIRLVGVTHGLGNADFLFAS